MKTVSLLKYSANCPFSRRFGAYLCEFFIILLVTFGLFIGIDTTLSKADGSIFETLNNNVSIKQKELISLISESKLLTFENNEAIEMNEIFDSYIVNLTYTSLNYYNIESIDVSYYENAGAYNDLDSNVEHDRLNFYYSVFKVENQNDYINFDINSTGVSYYRTIVFNSVQNEESQYLNTESEYPLLTEKYAKILDEYFIEGNKTIELEDGENFDADNLYLDLFNATSKNFDQASNDYSENYLPYISLSSEFEDARSAVLGAKIAEMTIIYFLIIFIYYFLVPILFKNGQTLVNKFMRIGYCSRNGEEFVWYQNIPKMINFFIMHYFVTSLIFILLYSGNAILFFNYKLFGCINFYVIYIFALIYLLVELCFGIFNKKDHLTISDYSSFAVAKYIQD